MFGGVRMELNKITTRKQRSLNVYEWSAKEAKAVVVLVHGASEHIDRYKEFAEYLVNNNITVYGYNHLGHGENKHADVRGVYFEDNKGEETLVNDLEDVCLYVQANNNCPLFVFGHSMGSLIARGFAVKTTLKVKGIILCGSLHPSKLIVKSGLGYAKVRANISGKKDISRSLNKMAFGSFNERISYNKDNVRDYANDPNCGLYFSNQAIVDLLSLIDFITTEGNIKKMIKTDYLIISGADDPFSDKTKQLNAFMNCLNKNNIIFKHKFYREMKHEILKEKGKQEVFADVVNHIESVLKG